MKTHKCKEEKSQEMSKYYAFNDSAFSLFKKNTIRVHQYANRIMRLRGHAV